jgi:isoquinoline 1-oxidoreductase beta subunit
MAERIDEGRRSFLKVSAAVGGGLAIGFYLPGCSRDEPSASPDAGSAAPPAPAAFEPNAWLVVAPDESVTVRVASSEMGQGILTAIPMLVAEELDADWSKVRGEHAPNDAAYYNPLLSQQATGGSTAIRGFWQPVREAGAMARDLLVAAAAKTWAVDENGCRTENGEVIHDASGRRLSYGRLADAAAALPPRGAPFLKEPEEFRVIGRPTPRLDTPVKVDGSAVFGQDVRVPGMLTATVARCPVFGGSLKSFDAAPAKAIKGVRDVVSVSGGVAVVADSFWAAKQGRDALEVEWDFGANAALSSETVSAGLARAAQRPGAVANAVGDADAVLAGAARVIEAVYEVPFLAHACMEPMNCTADVRPDGCDVWVPTQAQTGTQQTVQKLTGLPAEAVRVHTTFLGGGFGRRSEQDFVTDAVEISRAVGAPVKVLWTREDDMRHDFYRPATYNRLAAGLDAQGGLVAWRHHIAGPSILERRFPSDTPRAIDGTSVEGAANLPYGVANLRVSYVMHDTGVPVGFWRSVGSSQNAFITECFFDEAARAAGRDPLQLRLELLAEQPRHAAVLALAAEKAGWGSPAPEGRYRGIAVAESFGSVVAEVAEVSIEEGGRVRVHRVVCAVDCGTVVNPSTVEAQMESGIVYGLTAALYGEIKLDQGRVVQGNFNDYSLLRMDEMPRVEVHIVSSAYPPGGVGEPGTPPIAPAVANAVFAATGTPVRRLPIRITATA